MIAKAKSGVEVKIVLADPNGDELARRDTEEGLGGSLIARVKTSITYFRSLPSADGVDFRFQNIPMYASVFIFDDEILWTPHQYRIPGRDVPLLHVNNQDDGLYQNLEASFYRTFKASRPAAQSFG